MFDTLFDSIFQTIVWTNRMHDFDQGIFFPKTAPMKMGKRSF